MALHKDLTGTDLHEMKGADTATVDTVPIADGTGGTAFGKIGMNQIDLSSIPDPREFTVQIRIADISDATPYYVLLPTGGTILRAAALVETTYAGANPDFTLTRMSDSASIAVWTPDLNSETAGTTASFTVPATNATIIPNGAFRIVPSTAVNAVPFVLSFVIRRNS